MVRLARGLGLGRDLEQDQRRKSDHCFVQHVNLLAVLMRPAAAMFAASQAARGK
jgi:hypothetical protein